MKIYFKENSSRIIFDMTYHEYISICICMKYWLDHEWSEDIRKMYAKIKRWRRWRDKVLFKDLYEDAMKCYKMKEAENEH